MEVDEAPPNGSYGSEGGEKDKDKDKDKEKEKEKEKKGKEGVKSEGSPPASSGPEAGSSSGSGSAAGWWGDRWSESGAYEGMAFKVNIMDEPNCPTMIDSDLERLYMRIVERVER